MSSRQRIKKPSTNALTNNSKPAIITPDCPTRIEVIDHFNDKWWRLNNLYYIIDKHGKKVKFRCNSLQKKFLSELWYLNILLKARQFGGTTVTDIYFLDDCLFINNLEAGIIAHNRDDAQKIFRRKVNFPYNNLPLGLRNARSLVTDSRQELAFNNGSTIYVATSVRSATIQRLHISEFGKICRKYPDKAEEIKTGSLNAIHPGEIVVIESTAEGRHGDFFDFAQTARKLQQEGKKLTKMDYKFHFFPWFWDTENKLDPTDVVITTEMQEYFTKIETTELGGDGLPAVISPDQRAWYTKKQAILGEKMLAEYPATPDEAFAATITGAYYATQMTRLRQQKRLTEVPYEPSLPVNTAWDLGINDETVIIFHQRHGLENRIIDYYAKNDEALSHYVGIMKGKGYVYGTHYLPHDVAVKSLSTGKSRLETLRKLMPGEKIQVVEKLGLADGIESCRNFLATCWINAINCDKLIDAIDAYQREPDEKRGGFHDRPLHNWASDPADALRYLSVGFDPELKPRGKWQRKRRGAMVV